MNIYKLLLINTLIYGIPAWIFLYFFQQGSYNNSLTVLLVTLLLYQIPFLYSHVNGRKEVVKMHYYFFVSTFTISLSTLLMSGVDLMQPNLLDLHTNLTLVGIFLGLYSFSNIILRSHSFVLAKRGKMLIIVDTYNFKHPVE